MTTPTRETMTYKQGKIYKIEPIVEHEEGDIYIGSTCCKYLSQRMKSHRDCYKRWKEGKIGLTYSYNLFDKFGIENCQILLLENVSCENINELRAREAYHIRTLKCVNKVIPLRTNEEYRKDNKEKIKEYRDANNDISREKVKEYRDANKDEIKEKEKAYYGNNKDKILEKAKERYEKNKDAINEKSKEYRDANKDKIAEKRKAKYDKNKAIIAEKSRLKRQAKKEAENKL